MGFFDKLKEKLGTQDSDFEETSFAVTKIFTNCIFSFMTTAGMSFGISPSLKILSNSFSASAAARAASAFRFAAVMA